MISITLYAMESLALQDKHQSSIKAVEYKCMRRIIDETRRVRVCNDRIIDEAGHMKTMVSLVHKKLKWYDGMVL